MERAIAPAADAVSRWKNAEAAFDQKYPGDHRLIAVKSPEDPDRVAFFDDRQALFALRADAELASLLAGEPVPGA